MNVSNLFLLLVVFSSFQVRAEPSRPFWTEKSTYTEGDRVYFVGIASKVATKEKGRDSALSNARNEASNFFQMSDVTFLTFETQMTYEEANKDGTFDVYRLMFIKKDDVVKVKAKKIELAKQQVETNKEVDEAKKLVAQWDKASADIKQSSHLLRVGMTEDQILKVMGKPGRRWESAGFICLQFNELILPMDSGSKLYNPDKGYMCK